MMGNEDAETAIRERLAKMREVKAASGKVEIDLNWQELEDLELRESVHFSDGCLYMDDWNAFKMAVPWFVEQDADVKVSPPRSGRSLSSKAATLFPRLSALLNAASVTEVSINNRPYELLAWDFTGGHRFGWLCPPPTDSLPLNICDDHKELLASFGGIVERFNEPSNTWLLNLNEALTQSEASHDASFISQYKWAFEDAGLTLPMEPTEYYSIAREANGNTTLCHRTSGRVLMFAPDHCFKYLTVLAGCPEYSLYTINGAATFREWVNMIAGQWVESIGSPA